jgi:hypothetical protein
VPAFPASARILRAGFPFLRRQLRLPPEEVVEEVEVEVVVVAAIPP